NQQGIWAFRISRFQIVHDRHIHKLQEAHHTSKVSVIPAIQFHNPIHKLISIPTLYLIVTFVKRPTPRAKKTERQFKWRLDSPRGAFRSFQRKKAYTRRKR